MYDLIRGRFWKCTLSQLALHLQGAHFFYNDSSTLGRVVFVCLQFVR